MDNKRLLELAGVHLNEMDTGKGVSQMADIFEAMVDNSGFEEQDNEWGKLEHQIMKDLHKELVSRGMLG